jgi:hypothetical protein
MNQSNFIVRYRFTCFQYHMSKRYLFVVWDLGTVLRLEGIEY